MKLRYKYRIYPNKSVREFIAKQSGCNRFIWNYFIAKARDEGHYLTYNEMAYELTHTLKPQYPWLREACSQTLQQTIKDLHLTIRTFFKYKGKSGRPQFKKRSRRQSFRLPRIEYAFVNRDTSRLTISKCRNHPIKIILNRPLPEYTMCTILKESDDRYYACFIVEQEEIPHLYNKDLKHTGIDLGLKDLITTSAGEVVKPPQFFRKSEDNIKRKQRKLSHKQKGSKRALRAQKQYAKACPRVKRQRHDFLHKLTTRLANDNDAIAVESLNILNMSKNHKLAKSVMDASWGIFCSMLEYKLTLRGKSFISCIGFYPSTQICHSCENQTGPKGIRNLNKRSWVCSICDIEHDRDINAAKNIGNYADIVYHKAA